VPPGMLWLSQCTASEPGGLQVSDKESPVLDEMYWGPKDPHMGWPGPATA
jgi:hypothetical protein